jgi:hypothetical protein
MKDGLAALTKMVKVVMAYRPDRKKPTQSVKKQRASPAATRVAKKPHRG